MPKLFVNDFKQPLYGYMDANYLSNINSLKSNQNNEHLYRWKSLI